MKVPYRKATGFQYYGTDHAALAGNQPANSEQTVFLRYSIPLTTSERQGRNREGSSEGSLEQTDEPTNRNRIEGSLPWDELAKHNEIL
ncbi:hypothetical protein WDW89_25435, partial [Deltaproteobacteria bacterium TL4]